MKPDVILKLTQYIVEIFRLHLCCNYVGFQREKKTGSIKVWNSVIDTINYIMRGLFQFCSPVWFMLTAVTPHTVYFYLTHDGKNS